MSLKQKVDEMMAIRGPQIQRARGRSPMMRRNVIRRASGKCEVCAYAVLDVLNVHHIRPIGKGGESEILNLILLCPNCHALAHLCSRILAREVDAPALTVAIAQFEIPEDQITKLILIGTERAIVTYAGEVVERPQNPAALKERLLRDLQPSAV